MPHQEYILTIDLGTSGPKVSLFDSKLVLVASGFREVPLILEGREGVEQNPADWISGIEAILTELKNDHSSELSQVIAVNVTAQWSGTVALGENGKPLMNAIIWMDSRGAPGAEALTDGWPKVDGYGLFEVLNWIRITGGAPTRSGKDSISHILYLKKERPEVYKQTRVFLEPKDYINFYLTGKSAASYDSITVHWLTDNRDIHKIKYSDSLIKKSGIDRAKLPDLVAINSVIGKLRTELTERFGIPANAVVISGTPDLHSGAVGSGGVLDFAPHVYIGTSSWIVCHVPFKKTDLFHNMASLPSAIPGRYLLVNEQQTAGASLQFLRNQVFFPKNGVLATKAPPDFYQKMDELADSVTSGSEGLLFLPWLNGERSPFDVKNVRGGFINMSLRHEQRHMIRAVLEGVAYNLRWLAEYTQKFCNKRFESIRFIGGGAQSRVWSQILADVLKIRIEQMDAPLSANSRGAAALALVALGKLTLEEVQTLAKVKEVFIPREEASRVHDRQYKGFVDFFNRNQGWFNKANRDVYTPEKAT